MKTLIIKLLLILNNNSISEKNLNFIIAREGIVYEVNEQNKPIKISYKLEKEKKYLAYKDIKGNWTTGIGHLIKKNEKFLIKKKLKSNEVNEIFKKDIEIYKKAVRKNVKVKINNNQFSALVSLCFNIGETKFCKTELLFVLNNNGVLKKSHFINITPRLKSRRILEYELFTKRKD